MRQLQGKFNSGSPNDSVPAFDAARAFSNVVVAQSRIECRQCGRLDRFEICSIVSKNGVTVIDELVIIVDVGFPVAALDTGVEETGSVGRDFGAEKIQRDSKMKVEFSLHRRQIDHTQCPDAFRVIGVINAVLLHRLARSFDDSADTSFTHAHMMGFFGKHKLTCPRHRIEGGFRKAFQLIFAVSVREVGEHEKR